MRRTCASVALTFASACLGAAERPYGTEDTAYTIKPGHFAIEITPLTYARRDAAGSGDVDIENWSFGYSLLRAGLAPNTEAGIVFESWLGSHTVNPASGAHDSSDGTGSLSLRLKQNLFGNDGGDCACAIAPYVRLPTGNGAGHIGGAEWGAAVPLEYAFSETWSGLAVLYADWLTGGDGGRHFEASGLLSFTRSLGSNWSVLGECFYQLAPPSGEPPIATVNAGIGYTFSPELYVEVGSMIGITRAADDVACYFTVGKRF